MVFSNNQQCTKLMIYGLALYVTVSSLLAFSNAAPFEKKTVTIMNNVRNEEVLNVHCSSSEDDLGLKHLTFGTYQQFKFKVNWKGTTKFRCHFTWRGGGDHWFTIFKDSRDSCDNCEWHILGDAPNEKPIKRCRTDKSSDLFYDWDK